MKMKMQVYDTRDSGKALYVHTSRPMPSTTSAFSMNQSERSRGSMAIATHQAAYATPNNHR